MTSPSPRRAGRRSKCTKARSRGVWGTAALSLAYGCGLRAGEVVRLKAGDIDPAQMIIRIEQGKGRKDRHVMLSPVLLDLLRQWWKVRSRRHDRDKPAADRW
jgi:integrase/recombinase XerD